MAYNPILSERINAVLASKRGITQKKMFGGLCYLSRGYMFVGIVGDALMARVGPDAYETALKRKHVRVMDFTGKPLKGYVFVDPPGCKKDSDLAAWTQQCYDFVQSLPPKKKL